MTPISDYDHHNEEARRIWWEEEGRHDQDPLEYDDMMEQDSRLGAMDAFYEEHHDDTTESILDTLADEEYCTRWPQAALAFRTILADRGVPAPPQSQGT